MTVKIRTDLSTEIDASFPDNTQGLITPAILRTAQHDFLDSLILTAESSATIRNLAYNLETITGTVIGPTGNEIGVAVSAFIDGSPTPKIAKTDGNGNFSISTGPLLLGNHTVQVTTQTLLPFTVNDIPTASAFLGVTVPASPTLISTNQAVNSALSNMAVADAVSMVTGVVPITVESALLTTLNISTHGSVIQTVGLSSGATTSTTINLSSEPNGPILVTFTANNTGSTIVVIGRMDLFVTGQSNAVIPTPAGAAGMVLKYIDDFTSLSATPCKPGTGVWPNCAHPSASDGFTWYENKPGGGDFGLAAFEHTDSPFYNPFKIIGSFLRIRSTYDPTYVDPYNFFRPWYSGLLSSAFPDGSTNWPGIGYGYFEARIRTPNGAPNGGTWPAFWMLTTQNLINPTLYGDLEIDITEQYGNNPFYNQTARHSYSPATGPSQLDVANYNSPNLPQEFHRYGLYLDAATVSYYLDDTLLATFPNTSALGGGGPTPNWYILINLAMGGGWPVNVPPSHYFDMWIDYFRYYQVDPRAPVNTIPPTITGASSPNPLVGDVLTAVTSTGNWTNTPTSFTYQWKYANGTAIAGATNSTYTILFSDLSQQIYVTVAGVNAFGFTYAKSATTAIIKFVSSFNPNSISGILCRYRSDHTYSDAGVTLITTSGTNIQQISDLSGNAHHLIQTTTGANLQPFYVTNFINGYPAITFSNTIFVTTTITDWVDGPFSIFLVIINSTTYNGDFDVVINYTSNVSNAGQVALGWLVSSNTNFPAIYQGSGSSYIGLGAQSSTGFDFTPHLLAFVSSGGRSGGSLTVTPYIDGVALPNLTETAAGSVVATNMSIGSLNYGSTNWRGGTAEMLFYTSAVVTSDRQKLEGYLCWQYGMQGNLPSGHPYKAAPP